LYLIEDCGGDFKILNGYKDCSNCTKNHDENSYDFVLSRIKKYFEKVKNEGADNVK
jgi:hypothetical protein